MLTGPAMGGLALATVAATLESEGSRVLVAEMREFPVPSIREPMELP